MKYLPGFYGFAFLIVIANSGFSIAQETIVNTNQNETAIPPGLKRLAEDIERLQSNSISTRQATAVEISNYRKEAIRRLIGIVAGDSSDEVKVEAIHLLGEYRAKEAVGVLLDNFKTGSKIYDGLVTDAMLNPVGDALFQIGDPAITGLISKLAVIDNKSTQSTYMYVLRRIEPDKQILQLRIQKALDHETVENRKANLQRAIDDLKVSK